MSHHCHATGCTTKTKPEIFMCYRHWKMVPVKIQRAIWSTYRQGQCDDWQISHDYANAAREAVRYIAGIENKSPDTSVYDMLDPKKDVNE